MKSARLLLVLFCLLIAMTVPAAAYAPTNEAALGFMPIEIKIDAKEEVASLQNAPGEKSTIPVVPIPFDAGQISKILGCYFIFKSTDEYETAWKADRINIRLKRP